MKEKPFLERTLKTARMEGAPNYRFGDSGDPRSATFSVTLQP